MSDIAPLNGPSAASSYLPSGRIERPAASSTDVSRGSDQIELSDTAKILAKLSDLPEVREDLVARIKAEIADGKYETPDKLDAAIEGLAQDLT
ncbi:MAG: flagellar biosynthesis anti-sigma factor FlgM [Planctomycetota bacterium]